MAPLVDLVIAVHDARRPIARAVRSALAAGRGLAGDGLRVTVVCHNLGADAVAERLGPELAGDAAVRLLELADGIRSPAGPFNFGLDAADARFVSIMGSDDELEPGALAAWAHFADRRGLDVVIPVERHAGGGLIRTPPVRLRRAAPLDPVRDRLAYRTAPLGLLSTALVRRLGVRMAAGVATGEDQDFSARLWFSGAAIGYARGLPAYLVGADAAERTTLAHRSVHDEFAASVALVDQPWFRALDLAHRRAIAVKLVRIHVFSFIARRVTAGDWAPGERGELASVIDWLEVAAPGFTGALSRADAAVLDALGEASVTPERFAALAAARRRFGAPATLVTRRLGALLAPDAPLRFMVASALL